MRRKRRRARSEIIVISWAERKGSGGYDFTLYGVDGGGGAGRGVGWRMHRFHLLRRKVSLGGAGAEVEAVGEGGGRSEFPSPLMSSPKPSEALQPMQWTVRFLLDTAPSVLASEF